jgi:hypothetical protein
MWKSGLVSNGRLSQQRSTAACITGKLDLGDAETKNTLISAAPL